MFLNSREKTRKFARNYLGALFSKLYLNFMKVNDIWILFYFCIVPISGGTGTRNPGSDTRIYCYREMGGRQVEQGLDLPFCHIWWFFKVERTEGASELCKIIKFGKKWRKTLFEFCLKPIFRLIPCTHCARKFKKVQAKKLAKSNKSISQIIFFDQIPFFAISKLAKT